MCFISGSILATPKHLSISCWNVNGFSQNSALSNKLSNSDFLRYFNHHDILIFTETWSYDSWTVPGFKSISIPAKKHRTKRHGRLSGGIGFCFKTELQKGIAHISSSSDYIWCKLDKTFFNFDQDVFICAIYIPPRDSPYFDPDTFHNLENDIANLSEDGYVILAGDFNARTACALDFIDSDYCVHIPGDNHDLPRQNLKRRKNFDNHINEHGNCLLDICKTCDLRILNGRSKGDSFGKITYHSPKGINTVDYFIVSHNMLNLEDNVIVKKPTIFSDHSQITCSINTLSPVSIHNETEPLIETFNLPKQFLWVRFNCGSIPRGQVLNKWQL